MKRIKPISTIEISTSETVVSSGNFNGNIGATYTPDTNNHTYEIYWNNSKVYFIVDNELLHVVNATSETWTSTLSFYIFMDNVNSNNLQTNHTMSCRVATIRRLGFSLTQPTSKYQSGTTAGIVLKYGSGNLHEVVISGITNGSVVTIYDNTSAGGTTLWSSGSMSNQTIPFSIDMKGLPFFIGLTLVIATQSSNVLVIYE